MFRLASQGGRHCGLTLVPGLCSLPEDAPALTGGGGKTPPYVHQYVTCKLLVTRASESSLIGDADETHRTC